MLHEEINSKIECPHLSALKHPYRFTREILYLSLLNFSTNEKIRFPRLITCDQARVSSLTGGFYRGVRSKAALFGTSLRATLS